MSRMSTQVHFHGDSQGRRRGLFPSTKVIRDSAAGEVSFHVHSVFLHVSETCVIWLLLTCGSGWCARDVRAADGGGVCINEFPVLHIIRARLVYLGKHHGISDKHRSNYLGVRNMYICDVRTIVCGSHLANGLGTKYGSSRGGSYRRNKKDNRYAYSLSKPGLNLCLRMIFRRTVLLYEVGRQGGVAWWPS